MRPSPDSIHATLTGIFTRVFGREQAALTGDATSQTIAGWDSFRYVQVIVELESTYGIELDGPEIDDVKNVGDLVALVWSKTAATS